MTDENTLPAGWTMAIYRIRSDDTREFQFYRDKKPMFVVTEHLIDNAISIARALSSPTIEDAKVAIERSLTDLDADISDPYQHGMASGMNRALVTLDYLAPTPGPDLTQNTTPFGLLPKETREALRALPNGAVEIWVAAGEWGLVKDPIWLAQEVYRQNPDWTPDPLTKPAVPWDVLADEITNAVKVETGPNEWTIYGCIGLPLWNEDRQTWMGGNSCRMLPLSEIMSIDPGTCHPRDSLVMRPKGDE